MNPLPTRTSQQSQAPESLPRRRMLAAGGALALLGACGAPKMLGTYELTEVPAPSWRSGQSWTWQRTDGYTRLPAGVLTRSVSARTADGLRVQETFANGGAYGDALWGEGGLLLAGTLSDFGPVTGRFTPPLPYYAFPLQSGKTWQWRGHRTDSNDFRTYMTLDGRVDGWDTVDVLGKPVRTIIVVRRFNLGPPDPFRGNLSRIETEWYAPELAGPVRIRSEEYYQERRNIITMTPGTRYDLVLTGAQPGA